MPESPAAADPKPAAPTLVEHAAAHLRALCAAADLKHRMQEATEAHRVMTRSWGARRVDQPPLWSVATSDGTPMELSVVLEEQAVAIGVGVVSQAEPATPRSYWDSAQLLTQALATRFGLPLHRLRAVEDLFRPGDFWSGSLVAAHAVVWPRYGAPSAKIYLGATGAGADPASSPVREALRRLGFTGQWPRIADALHPRDVVSHLSLDLAQGPTARAKVYIQHHGDIAASRLTALGSLAADYAPGDGILLARLAEQAKEASSWPAGVTQRDRLQWQSNRRRYCWAATHLSLIEGGPNPIASAMHQICLPVLTRSDAEASTLIRTIMSQFGIGARSDAVYERCLEIFTRRPLTHDRYAHNFISAKRRADGTARVAIYFNPRMFYFRHGLATGDPSRNWRWHPGAIPYAPR